MAALFLAQIPHSKLAENPAFFLGVCVVLLLVFTAVDIRGRNESVRRMAHRVENARLRVGDEGLEVLSERFGVPIEHDPAPAAPASGGNGGLFPMSVQIHSADARSGRGDRADAANQAIMRTGGARLAQALGKTYAPLEALIATASTPGEALVRIETYCASIDPIEAAEILENTLTAFAANGSLLRER